MAYIWYSGGLLARVKEYLSRMPNFQAVPILVSQIDRSGVRRAILDKEEGFASSLFIDSGAFSVHTGAAKVTREEFIEDYIKYLNSPEINPHFEVCAPVDLIPGTLGKPKTPEDYAESGRESWNNFLYMRTRVNGGHRIMPIFHQGEDLKWLKTMLEYRDEEGKPLKWIGISPSNDRSQAEKNSWLGVVADTIEASSNPNVCTHCYGMANLQALVKYKMTSGDAISWKAVSGYGRIWTPEELGLGTITLSTAQRGSFSPKGNLNFFQISDEMNQQKFLKWIDSLNMTRKELEEDSQARAAVNIWVTEYELKRLNAIAHTFRRMKPKRLF